MKSGMGLKDRIWSFIKRSLVGRVFPSLFRALRTFFFEWLLVFILAVFVMLGFISLPLSVWWQSENSENQIKSIPLDTQTTLTVVYPAMLLVEDKPAQISFSVQEPLTQPLTITVNLSCKFLLATSSQTYCDSEPVITFQPLVSRVQIQTLQIANARLEVISKEEKIHFQLSNGIQDDLPISVEGTLRAALRGFFSNSLTLIITGILSAVGLLYNQFEKRREAEEKKEKEGKERAIQERDTFREWMQRQNARLAQETLDELERRGLAQYLAPGDLAWMRRLVDWSKGNLAELNFKTVPSDWLDAAAGALILARENGLGNDQEVSNALRQLPVDKLSENQRQAVQSAINLPEQARHWPLRPAKPDLNLIVPNELWKDRLDVNPFPYEHAEDEVNLLFSQVDAFWGEHPLYQRIVASNKSEIIVGETGTGKTAMALALGEYLHSSETLAYYLPGLPEEHEIQRALAKEILDFVCWHPTFMRKLGQDSRALLARVCVDMLGNQVVLARLDTVVVQEMEFVKRALNEPESRRRESIIHSQLSLFRETVVSLPARECLSHREWYDALAQCARSLGFRLPIRVVIDASGEHCTEWINLVVLPRIAEWKMMDIVATIFVTDRMLDTRLSGKDSPWLGFSKLEWDSSLLTQMLEHRFNSIMAAQGSRVVRPGVVDEHLWNRMIESAKNNPRCFIRLWNRMLAVATDGVLNKTVLDKALEGFECP